MLFRSMDYAKYLNDIVEGNVSEVKKVEVKKVEPKPISQRKFLKLPTERTFNECNPWMASEDSVLITKLNTGCTVKEVSDLIGRSISAVYARKCTLTNQGRIKKGIRFKTPKGILRKVSNSKVGKELAINNFIADSFNTEEPEYTFDATKKFINDIEAL